MDSETRAQLAADARGLNNEHWMDDHLEGVRLGIADSDPVTLSRIMFQAIENLEMWADVVKARTGLQDMPLAALIAELKLYRDQRGWNPNGFGGER